MNKTITNEEFGKIVGQFAKDAWERFDKLKPEEQDQIAQWLERDLTRAGIL